MIITKTPVRISFFSGGSDLPSFFHKEAGAALSVTIDKYIYVILHSTHNSGIRLKYDDVEHANNLDGVKHKITKETLKYAFGNSQLNGWEIASVSDVSYNGCGLGTSSAFTVGLLNGLLKDSKLGPSYLANEACKIEIVNCNFPIGKQDQYAAAYGGLNLFEFFSNGTVNVDTPSIDNIEAFEDKLIMFFTGITRDGNSILKDQSSSMDDPLKFAQVQRNRDKAFEAQRYLFDNDFDSFGDLLGQSWAEKKQISKGITAPILDGIYDIAMDCGALGGKLLGAGGGGFFLFYAPTLEIKEKITRGLRVISNVKHFPFKFSKEGSKVIYNG